MFKVIGWEEVDFLINRQPELEITSYDQLPVVLIFVSCSVTKMEVNKTGLHGQSSSNEHNSANVKHSLHVRKLSSEPSPHFKMLM